MINNNELLPARALLHDWQQICFQREKTVKSLPPQIDTAVLSKLLLTDSAVVAQFMTRLLAYLEEKERQEIKLQ